MNVRERALGISKLCSLCNYVCRNFLKPFGANGILVNWSSELLKLDFCVFERLTLAFGIYSLGSFDESF